MKLVSSTAFLVASSSGVLATAASPEGSAANPLRTLQTEEEQLSAAAACNGERPAIRFAVLQGDAVSLAVEGDIRDDLAKIGLGVELVALSKADLNAAWTSGEGWHLALTETWGAPYDPHSYASGWEAQDEGHHQAFTNFEAPATREELYEMVQTVQTEEDEAQRQAQWKAIHNYYHSQAVMLPLWGKRIPTVLNRRLGGYVEGAQQFDYPVHKLMVKEGSRTVTIAPGAQTGLFSSVGPMEPHGYRPNEFFSNNWVYEGLVHYGLEGKIEPALAESWSVQDTAEGGEEFTFRLREGVTFHDGTPWDCAAAELNLDHVFAGDLVGPDWHGWYGVPKNIDSWECADDRTLVVATSAKQGTFLQELTYIRPVRMLSPAAFVVSTNNETDAAMANSCPAGWGSIEPTSEFARSAETITCAGTTNVSGTGPWVFVGREQSDDADGNALDDKVTFVRNDDWWGGAIGIEELVIVRYESSDDVNAALLDGSLDAVWGSGVLTDAQIRDFLTQTASLQPSTTDGVSVHYTNDLQNAILLLNSGKPPLDDIRVRRPVIHAIDKEAIVEKNFFEIQETVDNVFPLENPYCNVELTPEWSYDLGKAAAMSCDGQDTMMVDGDQDEEGGEHDEEKEEDHDHDHDEDADKDTTTEEAGAVEEEESDASSAASLAAKASFGALVFFCACLL